MHRQGLLLILGFDVGVSQRFASEIAQVLLVREHKGIDPALVALRNESLVAVSVFGSGNSE